MKEYLILQDKGLVQLKLSSITVLIMHNKCIIHTTVNKLFLFSLRHQENVSALEFGQKVCEHTHFIVLMSTKVSMMVM